MSPAYLPPISRPISRPSPSKARRVQPRILAVGRLIKQLVIKELTIELSPAFSQSDASASKRIPAPFEPPVPLALSHVLERVF